MEPVAEIAGAVNDRERFLLCLHRAPDGDSVGSSLALGRGLMRLGKIVSLVTTDPVPRIYRFLPEAELFQDPGAVLGPWDAALVIDCGSLERTGRARPLVEACPLVVNIDHHETNSRYGHLNWVDPERAAAAEMVFELITGGLGSDLDAGQALALYTALATDTGFFAHPSTTARVLHTAARLVELGADPGAVSRHVQNSRSLASIRVLARALHALDMSACGRMAWMTLSRADVAAAGASPEDLEGVVNYARAVEGVEVGVLLVEQGDGRVRAGFRSRTVDVGRVAESLGGGGHPRAAGCTVAGPLDLARTRVLALVEEAIGS